LKICKDFVLNFGDKKNWLLRHDNAPSHTFLFNREFVTKNNMTVVPHPPHFSVFPQLKIKLMEVKIKLMEAKSQAVLNSLTEHDFQDAFRN
jgi:hypothetical protein